MRKRARVISYRRGVARRSQQNRGGLVATAAVVAVTAFTGTLFWPRAETHNKTARAVAAYDFACDVAYVHDGDTLRCSDGTRVRLHAIAARETNNSCSPGHPCPDASHAVSKAALERLAGSRITCVQVGKSYERVTAICQNARGIEINCAMVEGGAAAIWDRYDRQRRICRRS